jgi:hypothetical protein
MVSGKPDRCGRLHADISYRHIPLAWLANVPAEALRGDPMTAPNLTLIAGSACSATKV